MKSKVDKIDIDKLVPVTVDLSKLSDAVKNDVVKKNVSNVKIKDIEHKISDINNLATNTNVNAKINEVKNKIPNVTNLATNNALTAVENKIHDHSKYITTPEKLTAENFTARFKQANIATKGDFADFVKKINNKLKKLDSDKLNKTMIN